MKRVLCAVLSLALLAALPVRAETFLLVPARVWTGEGASHAGWTVLVRDGAIAAVGPAAGIAAPADARRMELPGATLTPGLIDLHSHLFLHPYDEESWNDQVLKEPEAYRTLQAAKFAGDTLRAGFTTLRDLGTEGAGFADVALKRAIDEGLVAGPRLFVSTRAIVATSSYGPGPRGFRPDADLPGGAQEISGADEATRAVREQAGRGADWIKFYADYRVGPNGTTQPAFTAAEMHAIVEAAHTGGRPVAAHAATDAGMRMAVEAGVNTIEHGYGGTPATFRLMHDRHVAYLPTLTAVEATETYFNHYVAGTTPATAKIAESQKAFRTAMAEGVTIGCGSDVGVFRHGDNWREPALMVKAGMSPVDAMRACTSTAAAILKQQDRFGRIAVGLRADLAAFAGDPTLHIEDLRKPVLAMKDGVSYRQPESDAPQGAR
ncbi:metal-dependent hydrolase family protein [Cognatilysobacter lacus]|uniref:Amidohydrolase family protein n=1 Tax=Cognatilysobacter lacus TaxID=1643323 RepID=A0A5D8Z4X3_9GAMM|nr:amidohydrolase family protein [Lysobacter lacus]TZF90045.1 amidohydrolase family protein [Lysobacter lacus]